MENIQHALSVCSTRFIIRHSGRWWQDWKQWIINCCWSRILFSDAIYKGQVQTMYYSHFLSDTKHSNVNNTHTVMCYLSKRINIQFNSDSEEGHIQLWYIYSTVVHIHKVSWQWRVCTLINTCIFLNVSFWHMLIYVLQPVHMHTKN